MANQTIKWAATLSGVREVSLLGTADLAFWAARLRPQGLAPAAHEGRARVMLIAAKAKFAGVRFRELSVSVFARREGPDGPREGAFLVRAFNSSRLFVFSERVFFSTPYEHGHVRVVARTPASIELVRPDGAVAFRAAMAGAGTTREAAKQGDGGWEGPVFLPGKVGRNGDLAAGRGKLFFARLSGHTSTYPFVVGCDSLGIHPGSTDGVLADLLASGFIADHWEVRADARHAKSKTYRVADAPPFG